MLSRGNHRFYRQGLTLHSAFHCDLLCAVFIQLCFVAFERVDPKERLTLDYTPGCSL